MFLETRKGVPTNRAGTPDRGHLEGPGAFAKPFFAGNPPQKCRLPALPPNELDQNEKARSLRTGPSILGS